MYAGFIYEAIGSLAFIRSREFAPIILLTERCSLDVMRRFDKVYQAQADRSTMFDNTYMYRVQAIIMKTAEHRCEPHATPETFSEEVKEMIETTMRLGYLGTTVIQSIGQDLYKGVP